MNYKVTCYAPVLVGIIAAEAAQESLRLSALVRVPSPGFCVFWGRVCGRNGVNAAEPSVKINIGAAL